MITTIDGIEHAYDDNGFCQRHGAYCSMATADGYHGYHDGDRVRDARDGSLGTVRFLELGTADRPSEGYAVAEVRWDSSFVADELDVALPHLERLERAR